VPIPLPIETKRLLVRPFVPETDSEAMLAVYGDPEVMRYIPGGALSLAVVQATLDEYAQEQQARGFSSWALLERSSNRLIGDVGFRIFDPTDDVELGYTLARDTWGRGYATEAGEACVRYGFDVLGVEKIVADVDPANAGSIRVLEKCGLQRTGTLDDGRLLYEVTAGDWRLRSHSSG
jgi:RimJ/RimL family protein N-acetyltransferase